jgi:broad specificity phosphatase PhoE
MSTLILMRHGQASFGAANYDQLNANGEAQARALRPFLAERAVMISKVIAGPRVRHRETARLAIEGLALPPIEIVDELDEFSDADRLLGAVAERMGKPLTVEAGFSKADILTIYTEQILLWADDAIRLEGVPTVREYRRTVAALFERFMNPSQPDDVVLAVTSGGLIGTAFAEALGLPDRQMGEMISTFSVGNCSLTAIHDTPHGRSVLYYNQMAHLPLALASTH